MRSRTETAPASPTEFTARAVVLGVSLSVLLSGANAYLGLFAGMTVSASIPAAVISMGILRAVGGGILENNLVQTAASAGESVAAGAIFTLPALVLLGAWSGFPPVATAILVSIGGVLGVLFTIPLRRSLVLESDLPFPEGVATAEVLRTGHATGRQRTSGALRAMIEGVAFGGIYKLLEAGAGVLRPTLEAAFAVRSKVFYFGTGVSPALMAVGYIVGLNVAVVVLSGGLINWFFIIPFVAQVGPETTPIDAAWAAWSEETRFVGVGAMTVGGLWTLLSMRRSLFSAFSTARQGVPQGPVGEELSRRAIGSILGLCLILLFATLFFLSGSLLEALGLCLLIGTLGYLFCAVAAYMAGLVGSSNNPVSGVTLATILLTSVLLLAFGVSAESAVDAAVAGPAAAIIVGSVICVAAAIGGDNMQDLKAGHLLGASPRRQQIMQLLGVVAAALVMAPILSLLHTAYGFGPPTTEHPNALRAPQATLMASVAEGVFGGNLPWKFVLVGAGIACLTIALDQALARRDSTFRVPVLAVAVGVYLPLELSVPVALGGALRALAEKRKAAGTTGLLLAAGLITGEALMGIVLAAAIVGLGGLPLLDLRSHGLSLVALFLAGSLLLLRRPGSAPDPTAH